MFTLRPVKNYAFTVLASFVLGLSSLGAQTESSPAPSSAAPRKFDVDSIPTFTVEERVKRLSEMSEMQRVEFAKAFRQLPESGQSNAKINALFLAWGAVDPLSALKEALALPTDRTRTVAAEAMAHGVTTEGAPSLARALRAMDEKSVGADEKERLVGLAVVKWSQKNPADAAQFEAELYPAAIERLQSPKAGDGVLMNTTRAVAMNWGSADPQAAVAFYGKEPVNYFALENAILGWWRKDAKAAATYVDAHLQTPGDQKIAGLFAGAVADQNPQKGLQWLRWTEGDREQSAAILQIAGAWAERDASTAAKWATALPPDKGRNAVALITGIWTQRDQPAVEKWLKTLKDERRRDAALSGYISAIASKQPASAMEWALKISNAKLRVRYTKPIAELWMKEDAKAAKAWIEKSKMPESEKKAVLDLN